jgi:flagellar protein FlaJ
MSYSQSSLRRKETDFSKKSKAALKAAKNGKVSFNADLLPVDLFCQLAYMSSLATSNLPRNLLFDYAARLPYTSSRYFSEVNFMAKRMNYDYSEACRMVGEKTKEAEPKALLLRMSGALSSGETEAEFLQREAFVLGEKYGEDYERRVEGLKRWTDTYIALILSAALIVVISVVSMLIFPQSPTMIALLTWIMLISTGLGVWIMYRASPKETKTHNLENTSRLQALAMSLFKFIAAPACIVIFALSVLMKLDLGLITILLSLAIAPVGFLAYWNDKQIDKLDNEISAFIRSLGGIAKAIGSTVTEALGRMDQDAMGALKPSVKNLNNTLKFGISPELCWRKFVEDTGSEQVNRTIRIFWDGIACGGDPGKVGGLSSMFALKVSLLRNKRSMIASGFSYLCLTMQGVLALLLVGIYNILLGFSSAVAAMAPSSKDGMDALSQLPTFAFFSQGSTQLHTLYLMVTAMLLMLTAVNALAIKVVEGGSNLKILFYMGITLMLTGLCLTFVPNLVQGMFSTLQFSP